MPDLNKTPASPGAADGGGSDWPAQATEAIVGLVDTVREKVNGPATSVARGIVYGTLGAIVGLATLVLVLVVLFRGFDVGIDALLDLADIDRRGRSTWITHLLFGLLLVVPGALLWRKGTRSPAPAS